MKAKTFRGGDGKWYVEIMEDDSEDMPYGYQLDAADDIDSASFVPPGPQCGFSSRRRAREYLTAFIMDTGEKITGGLH